MEQDQISKLPLLVILISGILTIVLLIAIVEALLRLRGRPLDDVARVLWAFLIVTVPFMGLLAFYLVRPGDE